MRLCNKAIRTFNLLITLAVLAGNSFGQTFKHITIDEGLSTNHITSFYKSDDGFLWIGTPVGLNRYDGHSVKIYKTEGSLKDNSVENIWEGPNGCLWVRTSTGINVFDVKEDKFYPNTDSLLNTMGLETSSILDLKKDKNGDFWFLLSNKKLFKYNTKKQTCAQYKSNGSTEITGIATGKNNIWLIHSNGIIQSVVPKTLEVQLSKKFAPEGIVGSDYRIFIDKQDDPWIYSVNTSSGVYWWPDFTAVPKHFSISSVFGKLNNNTVMGIAQDVNDRIWIATDHGGVNLFEPRVQKMQYLVHEEYNERSLSHNGTSTILSDKDGIVWVGTYKGGINYYHENLVQFPVYKHYNNVSGSLPYEDVNRIVEDKDGNLWIGTNGGGLIFYNKANNSYKQYLNSANDPNSIGSNVVVSLLIDKENNLWVGTYYGGLNLFKNGKFIRYVNNPNNPKSISNNSVWELFEDSKGRFWVGTLFGGVNLMDKTSGTFSKLEKGPTSPYTCSILEDKEGNVWFGTATGIEVLDAKDGSIRRYRFNSKNSTGLSNDYISDLIQDSKGRIWAATRGGLNLYNPKYKTFTILNEKNGLEDNTVHTILEDDAGKLWLSTSKGISVVSEGKDNSWIIRNFDKHDGLQSTTFNENSAVKLRSGDLLFGGPKGFNRISPEGISHEKLVPKPLIVDFLLFNKSVKTGEAISGKVVLKGGIEYTDEITLRHYQNVFSLDISPMYFLHPERVKIKYTLEGFNKEWLELDSKSRLATFTNLNAGEYIFKVIVSTDGEEWSEPFTLLRINIKPPFWRSGWAYAIYILGFLGALYLIRKLEKKRQHSKYILHQEREEAKRLKELDQLKTKFFTNVSHEFRTPVSLIISPVEKLVNNEEDESKRSHLELVHRNARRLLNLVNQLLDFRKIDTQSLQVHNVKGDILNEIREHAISFKDMAESKEIEYRIEVPNNTLLCYFDHDKIERIVFNLLSNAFKFTPVGGKVSLVCEVDNDTLKLVVEDTGIGISEQAKSKIFERYFQDDLLKPLLNQGSGIGLAITKEYVNLLNGTLEVASEQDLGSSFSVSIPLEFDIKAEMPIKAKKENRGNVTGNKVLVVEDNDDFRFYLIDNLKELYQVEEARNFNEGWEKALSFHPDIIVSDVNMPGNSGIELCKKLKADSRTVHIPVILLTALTSDNYQIEGIEAGATDYVVKPFNVELLLSKLKSHINQKASFEKTFKKQLAVEPTEMELESNDAKFMRKALDVVEKNLSNALFSVEVLADEMNVSRVGLYKRILTLSGYSPSEFIRNIRLKRAAQLLEDTGMTVAEVAYEVGFNNPKVFSKYFRDVFGKIPSEYRKTND